MSTFEANKKKMQSYFSVQFNKLCNINTCKLIFKLAFY